MSTVQIVINKLIANYSSSCNFKIKIVVNSANKEQAQNKHSFKYEKGSSEVQINEKLTLNLAQPLNLETKLQFSLEVYTKTGYKTAGIGLLSFADGIASNKPYKIQIKKCPLGDGSVEIQFINFNLSANANMPLPENSIIANNQPYINNNNTNTYSNNNYSNNNNTNNNAYSNNSPYSNNNISQKNYSSNNNNNMNGDLLREKEQQIDELKTKIDYYEQENNELKGLIKDFKKEKKQLTDEKNSLLTQHKEQMQKLKIENEDLQMQNMSLQQNMNLLQNNKNDSDKQAMNIKSQTDKQIRDLMQQVKNLTNLKLQLENDNKSKEEKIINLEKKNKEISINYQKKLNEMGTNFSSEKNNALFSHNEQLKIKEDEIVKLNIKVRSLEENIQSLNEIIEATKKENNNNNGNVVSENMTKLLEQISEKDKKIFKLQTDLNELNDKINNDLDNKNTQNMISTMTEKELKKNINELQGIINEKDNELNELRSKYDTLKFESTKYQAKIDYNGGDEEFDQGNNEMFINQLKEIQKTYKDREEKLLKEKNEEIRKLKMKNKDLVRESVVDSNIDINKYINEINRLKNINNSLEEDLGYYKELNSKFVDNEKKSTVYETENIKLKNLLQQKKDEMETMTKKHKELEELNDSLEKQLVTSKEKLGNVLNDLAEAESKCVYLEEEQKKMKKNMGSVANGGGYNIMGKFIGKKNGKK